MPEFEKTKHLAWGLSRIDFGTLKVASSGFFLPKIVPEERGYCEKKSGIIVIYLNMAESSRKFVWDSGLFGEFCLKVF